MSRSYNPNHILHSSKSLEEKKLHQEQFKRVFEPDVDDLEKDDAPACDNLDFGKVGDKMIAVLSNADVARLILESK